MLFVIACAVLATPLMAGASDALVPPMGVLAALLAPLQPQMYDLHSRQLAVPPACVQVCEVFANTIDVRALTS